MGPNTISNDITLYIHATCKQKVMDNTDPILAISILVMFFICFLCMVFLGYRDSVRFRQRIGTIPLEP